MSYWLHDFESNTAPGTKEGTCAVQMEKRDGSHYTCGSPWYSVLHRPDQFRHWCQDLEEGRDCMHFEDSAVG